MENIEQKKQIVCVGIDRNTSDSLTDYFGSTFTTCICRTAEEFIQGVKDLKPAFIFLNSHLPDFDNCREICIAIRSYIDTEMVPLIIITDTPSQEEKITLYKAGLIDGYFPTPLNIDELTAYANVFLHRQALQEELEEKNRILSKYSITDDLMDIYNRRYLMQRLEEELACAARYKYPVSAMMIDVDFFKRINDVYGHAEGDIILRDLAEVLKKSLRNVDIICRYGGEEIVVVMPHTDLDGAQMSAERLRKKISENKFGSPVHPRSLTISIGLAMFSFEHKLHTDEVLRFLDKLLYEAKHSGRNRVCASVYEPESEGK